MIDFMDSWLQFLVQQGAHLAQDRPTEVAHFGSVATQHTLAAGFIAPLTDLGLIAASGEDAASFLHSQLTNDVLHLGAAEARLAGYCSPKGRLLATLLMWKTDSGLVLQLPREIQPAIQKRLQMFVLRSKVKLEDVSAQQIVLGLGGRAAAGLLARWFPNLPASPYAIAHAECGSLIRVADAFDAPRYQLLTSMATAQTLWPVLSATLQPVGNSAWRWSAIQAGVPQVTLPTQEQFVPQMLNFDLIGGVNFKKGCYPGQEIVARMQYLGKSKRRMMLAMVDTAGVASGTEVFSSTDPEQPCGMIVNAESNGAQQSDCLVEIKIAALDNGAVHCGSASGALLRFQSLPYALPPDAA
jgi:folate-binding protein YgfZ